MDALESCSTKNNMWDGVVKAIHKKLWKKMNKFTILTKKSSNYEINYFKK